MVDPWQSPNQPTSVQQDQSELYQQGKLSLQKREEYKARAKAAISAADKSGYIYPEPRYDETWRKGVAWLERCALTDYPEGL